MASEIPSSTVHITPMLSVPDAAQAIDFYKAAFGAVETLRMTDGGKIAHAEIRIGDAPLMLSDPYPDMGAVTPSELGGSPVMILLQVADVDAVFAQAVAAGATVARPLQDAPDGSLRNGKLSDPFGHRWMIVTVRKVGTAAS